jgi:hypothetical protein
MTDQIKLGQEIDNNVQSSEQVFKKCKKNSMYPPIYPHAVMVFCDENHSRACIGGAGHEGSSGKKQWRIAVDQMTGHLKLLNEGGVMPNRKS